MLAAGLLPLAGGGLVVGFGLSRMLSLSLGRLDPLLERAQEATAARDPALSRDLSQARVDLLQADLARRTLARLAPWALLAAVAASAAILVAAAIAWYLGGRSRVEQRALKPVAWALFLGNVANAVIAWNWFFIAPQVFATIVAVLLGYECFVKLPRQ